MQPAIEVSKLTKVYRLPRGGRKIAVDSLDLAVREGEIFGFLGPNGAGKTSTIKTLLGFIRPTSGSASIFGMPVDTPEARKEVGYLPEQPYFHKFMSPREIISLHAGLIGVNRRQRRDRTEEAIWNVGLQELATTPISKLSKGQVQRVGLAQALIGDPRILILDEPASGLDPLGRYQIRDLLIRLREQGKTIFLSSHLLSEIETVCDRVAVLSQGKLAAVGTPDEIKHGGEEMVVRTSQVDSETADAVVAIGGRIHYAEGDTVIHIRSDRVYELLDLLRGSGLPLISASQQKESLEQAFLRLAA